MGCLVCGLVEDFALNRLMVIVLQDTVSRRAIHPFQSTIQYVPWTQEIGTPGPSQNYATTRAQYTYQVQHVGMASRMGARLAWTVADHALLHVRLLVSNDYFVCGKLAGDVFRCSRCVFARCVALAEGNSTMGRRTLDRPRPLVSAT